MSDAPLHRSLMCNPGSRPDLMRKAEGSGADSLLFDLEDSVAANAKAEARRHVHDALSGDGALPVYVRVNHPASGWMKDDLEALTGPRIEGIFLPKVEQSSEVREADSAVSAIEKTLGLPKGKLGLVVTVETALGLRNIYDAVSASRRVRGVCIASAEEGDLMVDINGRWSPVGEAMLYPRSRVVCEARAAGVSWLVDGVFMKSADDEACLVECTMARNIGYTAKMAIHPRQIPIFHKVFSPSAEELEFARGQLAAFREAEAKGIAAIQYRGMLVDYANAKRAEGMLALAGKRQGR